MSWRGYSMMPIKLLQLDSSLRFSLHLEVLALFLPQP